FEGFLSSQVEGWKKPILDFNPIVLSEVVNHQTANYYISHHREYFTRIIRFTGKQLYPIYANPYSPKVCETYIRPLYMRIKPSESKVFIILINFTLVNLIASLSNLVAITYSRFTPV